VANLRQKGRGPLTTGPRPGHNARRGTLVESDVGRSEEYGGSVTRLGVEIRLPGFLASAQQSSCCFAVRPEARVIVWIGRAALLLVVSLARRAATG
jgi:hypothetical protein